MKINYDKIADAIYLNLIKGKIKKTIKLKDRLLVDVDKKGNIIGIEILDASSQLNPRNIEKVFKKGLPTSLISTLPVTV